MYLDLDVSSSRRALVSVTLRVHVCIMIVGTMGGGPWERWRTGWKECTAEHRVLDTSVDGLQHIVHSLLLEWKLLDGRLVCWTLDMVAHFVQPNGRSSRPGSRRVAAFCLVFYAFVAVKVHGGLLDDVDEFLVYPPTQEKTTMSPSPFFAWFTEPLSTVQAAVSFWSKCKMKMTRDMDKTIVKDRLDLPLTHVERQFCQRLEHRLWHEWEKQMIDESSDKGQSDSDAVAESSQDGAGPADAVSIKGGKEVARLHVYPRFGETMPSYKEFFTKYSSMATPLVFEELGKRMITQTSLLDRCLEGPVAMEDEISLPQLCPAFLKDAYRVPDFVAADLYQSGAFRTEDGQYLGRHCNKWPIAQVRKVGTVEPLKQTTLGSQALLLVVRGKVEVKLYNKEHHPLLLPKFDNRSKLEGQSHVYTKNVFAPVEDELPMGDDVPCYSTILTQHESLYIPSKNIYSWRVLESEEENEGNSDALVITHEFLDVAALNNHKEALRMAVLKSGGSTHFLEERPHVLKALAMFQKDINAVNAQLNKEAFIEFTGQAHELEPEEEYAANAFRDFKALQLKRTELFAQRAAFLEIEKVDDLNFPPIVQAPETDTDSATDEESPATIRRYYRALKSIHTDAVKAKQSHGPPMIWDDYKSYPRPESNVKVNRREKYKQWQAQKSWEQLLHKHTGPAPEKIFVKKIAQEYVDITIKFEEALQKNYLDNILVGFLVSGFSPYDIISGQKRSDYRFSPQKILLGKNHSFAKRTGPRSFRIRVQGLRRGESYAFRIAPISEEAVGEHSDTIFIKTTVYTVPGVPPAPVALNTSFGGRSVLASINIGSPSVTGGYPVTALAIKWIRTDGAYPAMVDPVYMDVPWSEDKEIKSFKDEDYSRVNVSWFTWHLENMIPGAKYKFQVAAKNSLGLGPYSKYSSEFRMALGNEQSAPAFIRGVRYAFKNTPLLKDLPRAGPTVIMRMAEQKLVLSIKDVEGEDDHAFASFFSEELPEIIVEGWRSHFSPLYDVKAEIVIANPEDAAAPLRNAHVVNGRVALIERGTVPFYLKVRHALEAGAVGVIIVDYFDDRNKCAKREDDDTMRWDDASQLCVRGSVRGNNDGFGKSDKPDAWNQVALPTLLVLGEDGGLLKKIVQQTVSGVEYM